MFGDINPNRRRVLIAKPGQLAFGIAAGVLFDIFPHFFETAISVEIDQHFLIAKGAQFFEFSAITGRDQFLDFCHQSVSQHLIDPIINAPV